MGGKSPPKKQGGQTLAAIMPAITQKQGTANGDTARAARILISAAGRETPQTLHAAHALECDAILAGSGYAHSTRRNTAHALARILNWLTEHHGAPRLAGLLQKYPGLRPRNVTATEEEREVIMQIAPPHLRLWLLLCSDLAIRSGTASKIGPDNYNPEARTLRFTTKHHGRVTLPVTQEIQALIEQCNTNDPAPYVRQLTQQIRDPRQRPLTPHFDNGGKMREAFRKLCVSVGINRRIIPHDLRRTAAVGLLELTGDLRDVQALLGHRNLTSTLWYLDHDARPVKRSHLELIKRPAWAPKEKAS